MTLLGGSSSEFLMRLWSQCMPGLRNLRIAHSHWGWWKASVPSWLLAGGPTTMPCGPTDLSVLTAWQLSSAGICEQREDKKGAAVLSMAESWKFGSYFYLAVILRVEAPGSAKGRGIKLYLLKEDVSEVLWTHFKFSTVCLQSSFK